MICHVVDRPDDDADSLAAVTVTALCGAQAIVFYDGEIAPEDFDFVDSPDSDDQADCMRCLVKLASPMPVPSTARPAGHEPSILFQWRRVAGTLRRFFVSDPDDDP